jgi:hypothetical protein
MVRISRFVTLFFILTAITYIPDSLNAQQRPVHFDVQQNNRGGYTFYAINNTPSPVIVTINFSNLTNLSANHSLPYSSNVLPGRRRFLSLSQSMEGVQSRYRYNFRYHSGCLQTEPEQFEYLLPFPEGKSGRGGLLSYVYERIQMDTPDDWYSLVFHMDEESPTTIHAARKGRVTAIRDGENSQYDGLIFSSNRNYVTVVHDDCTFARYSIFRDDRIFVDIGDTVYPGDALGEMAGDEFGFGNQIRLLISYRNDESVVFNRDDAEGIHQWHYVKPLFRTTQGEFIEIEPGNEYISIHPEAIITEEMGRRERRRWSRSQ